MRRKAIRIASAAALFLSAVAAGFLLSSPLGKTLVRLEVEEQLGRALRGEVTIGSAHWVVGDGLWLKGERVDAYPARQGEGVGAPVLSAESVAARLDVLAILTGKLRLRELNIDGLHLRLERFADGRWSLPPLQTLLDTGPNDEPDDLEQHLGLLKAIEAVTRTLLARPVLANRVQLHYARVTFIDHTTATSGQAPVTLHVRGIDGRLEHNWLAGKANLSLRAHLTDSVGRRSNIEVSGQRGEGQSVTLAASDLPLATLGPYLAKAGPHAAADGTLSGVVAYRTPRTDHGVLELDWLIRNLDAAIPLREEPLHIESPRLRLQGRTEIHPGRLRLAELELEGLGGAGELTLRGVVERPLRNSSSARIATAVRGTGLTALRRIVSWLPETDAKPLTQLLERFEDGRIERIEARGAARVSQWRRLVEGKLASLPSGFVLTTDVRDIAVSGDGPAALTHLSAHAEWSGDRIELRQLKANWKGIPLPAVDAAVQGVSHLLHGPTEARELTPGAEPIPGLETLWRVLAGGHRDGPAAPLPEMNLMIESLDYPALRWPIRNARVQIGSTPEGVEIEIAEGTWAGAPVRAQAAWLREPEPHWNVEIAVSEPARSSEDPATPQSSQASQKMLAMGPETPWFHGRIEVGSLEAAGMPSSGLEARFALTGPTLTLSDVQARLAPNGLLDAELTVDLDRSDRLAVTADVELLDGELNQIGSLVGLERDQWSGQLFFKAGLHGWVDPELPLLAELSGPIYILARQGQLRRDIPMAWALAQATEGFNPFASRSVARYESIEMTLQLDRGRLSTDDLEIDGPIRVSARGSLDVARPDPEVNAVVGIFLFRQADQTLGQIPLLSHLISDHGLIGGYFGLTGSPEEPEVRGLPLDSIAAAIPDVVKAPFRALGALGRLLSANETPAPPAKPNTDWPDSADEWRDTIEENP